MLKINVETFDVRQELSIDLKKEDVSFKEDVQIDDILHLDLVLTKDKEESVIIEGTITGNLLVMCSRCLTEFKSPVNDTFITVYKDKSSYTDEDKDNDINQFENNEIDLCDYLRETLLIEIPMKPLHSEDCKGICPVCGINKNEENCDCQMELKHNPFDKLDELKLKKKEN